MADEEKGQDSPETPEEKPEEQPEEAPEETETEPVTAEGAMKLAQALQKGYTLTRQEMAVITENQEKIQTALENFQKKPDEFGGEEEPLTVSKLVKLQKQQKATADKESAKIDKVIDSQLSDLRIQGVIKTKEDEDKLMNYAVSHKITDLSQAAKLMVEVEKARKEGQKIGAKGKVKEEAGSQIGTSQKTSTGEKEGVPYGDIQGKDHNEIASGN